MIEIINLHRRWGNFSLSDINLKISKGEFLGLFGRNGAGKTLFLETIAGIWYPDQGDIFIRGKRVTLLPPEQRNIGFVYQQPLLFPHLSVRENVSYGLNARKKNKKEIANRIAELDEMLKLGGILQRKNINLLSGGEKQKVALARVLAVKPEIILFDEPTQSLDGDNRECFYQVLSEIRKSVSPSIIFISHEYQELKGLADRIVFIEKGRFTA